MKSKIKTTKTNTALCGLLSGLLLLAAGTSHASFILDENFDAFSSGGAGSQFNTGLTVYHTVHLPGWSDVGLHAVNLGAGNIAAMLWTTNKITLVTPITANDSGVSYEVAFDAGPAVWASGSQVTAAADGLVFKILRGNSTVLSQSTYMPGAWAGSETLVPASFQYTGDGSGDIRISIETLIPGADRFGGAVDNLTIQAVPEPTSALLLLGSGAMLLLRRRRASV